MACAGVRKEVWTHVLAYNLIRTIIAQAASRHDIQPRSISFKGTIQTLEAFQPLIAFRGERSAVHRMALYQQLLDAVATHQVADRPDRFEPRVKKHRRNHYGWLTKPRRGQTHDGKRVYLKLRAILRRPPECRRSMRPKSAADGMWTNFTLEGQEFSWLINRRITALLMAGVKNPCH